MNRADRRKQDRNLKKNLKTIDKLTPQQTKLINIAAREKAKEIAHLKINELAYLVDRCTSAALVEKDWSYDEIEKFQLKIAELLQEDTEKSNELERKNIDMAKVEKEVKNYIEELLDKGVPKKQAIDDLVFKFPKLSKSMLLNAYAKVKEEKESKITREKIVESAKKHGLNKEGKNKIAKELKSTYSTIATYISRWKITEKDIGNIKEQETEKAVNQIMDIIEGESKNKEPIVAKNATLKEKPVIKENCTTENKEEKPMENKLKVLSMTLKGENGEYKVCEKGVELQNKGLTMFFENTEELENFTEEYKQVFEMVK